MTHPNGTSADTPRLTPEQERAVERIREASSFLLVGHVRPDGDCIGAQGALAHGLRSIGKTVHIVNPDPVGEEFGYLSRDLEYGAYTGQELPQHDVVCLLDFNELSRCGKLAEAIASAPSKKLVVDHHPPAGEPWWDDAYLDPTASATGVLIHRILGHLDVELGRAGALGVFTSIVTDTGWFRYSNTDVETMQVATDLFRRGVDPTEVYASIYQRKPAEEPRALAAMLQRAVYHGAGRLAVVDHPLDAGDGNDLQDSDTVLDVLRSVGSVEVVLYVRELEPGVCKLSARSKTDFNVNQLARRFGGGGHVKASGATIEGPLTEVCEQLVSAALEQFETR